MFTKSCKYNSIYYCSLDAQLFESTVGRDVFFNIKEVIINLRAKVVILCDIVKKVSRPTVDSSSAIYFACSGVIQMPQGSVNII